ncbi:MAG: autotransporter outer membrane beta-barrel domain-containing protein [Gammaproteobacteria bacterium]
MTRIKIAAFFILLSPLISHASPQPFDQFCTFLGDDDVCPGAHPGDATTSNRTLNDSVTAIAGSIAKATALALRSKTVLGGTTFGANLDLDRETGIAAGDGSAFNWAAWGSYSRTHGESGEIYQSFDSTLDSFLVGVDRSYSEDLIYGIAFGYDDNDVDTLFNVGEQDITSFTIAPYLGYVINPNFTVDVSAGYSNIDIDQFRLDTTNLTSIISGDTDSDRFFVSGNLNGYTRYNDFVFSGRVGIIYANDDKDAIVETGGPDAFTTDGRTVELGELQVGGDIAYSAWKLEPYASFFYEYDFIYEDLNLDPGLAAQFGNAENDTSDFRIGFGARYFGANGFSSILEWTAIADREEFESHVLSLTLRLDF